jgi:hypothetical protein
MTESEMEKWSIVHSSIVEIEEFLDWLQSEKRIVLCEQEEVEAPWTARYHLAPKKVQDYWMEFHKINPQRLEEERRALLKEAAEASKTSGAVTMGIRCEEPPMVTRYFESRFRFLSRIWAWFMRRKGYDTSHSMMHLVYTTYLVVARKEVV